MLNRCLDVYVAVLCDKRHETVYALHSRYANLKQVVLDELLAQHGNAQLNAELHEAACMGTLDRKGTSLRK